MVEGWLPMEGCGDGARKDGMGLSFRRGYELDERNVEVDGEGEGVRDPKGAKTGEADAGVRAFGAERPNTLSEVMLRGIVDAPGTAPAPAPVPTSF